MSWVHLDTCLSVGGSGWGPSRVYLAVSMSWRVSLIVCACVSRSNCISLSPCCSIHSPRGRPCPSTAPSLPRAPAPGGTLTGGAGQPRAWAQPGQRWPHQVPAFGGGPAPCPPNEGYKFTSLPGLPVLARQWSHLQGPATRQRSHRHHLTMAEGNRDT